jgi:polyisoprenoid-binding protein YceI
MILTSLVLLNPSTASSFVSVEVGPDEAQIKASIRYTVIGRYNAEFENYKGNIAIDWENDDIRSVDLIIDAASIFSNCDWCDKIVRSKQLLYVEEYPQIIFRSDEIIKNTDGYQVKGILDLHGEQRELSFPFQVSRAEDQLIAKGQWIIERKEFKIIWNKLLDKGGVLVGNTITVDWEINLPVLN